MFQAYIDESASGDGQVFVMAGYLAPSENWAEFSNEWQALLRVPPELPSFKMRKMARSRARRAEDFYCVIKRHVSFAISCTVYVDEMVKIVRGFDWPAGFPDDRTLENPFYFAFKAIIDVLAQVQDRFGITEPVDFIFDDRTDKKRAISGYDLMKEASSPAIRDLMGVTPIFRDDEKVLPLQAGDFHAWWVRKWEEENRDWVLDPENMAYFWQIDEPIPGFAIQFREKDFEVEMEKVSAAV